MIEECYYNINFDLYVRVSTSPWGTKLFTTTVGGIKTVTFPSRPVPSKQKCVPILFNRKTGIEQEVEQATNGATDYASCSHLELDARGVQESRKEYYFSQSASCRGDLNRSAIGGQSINNSENCLQSSGDCKTLSYQKSSSSTVSQQVYKDSGGIKASILSPRANELALVLDTLVRHAQRIN